MVNFMEKKLDEKIILLNTSIQRFLFVKFITTA